MKYLKILLFFLIFSSCQHFISSPPIQPARINERMADCRQEEASGGMELTFTRNQKTFLQASFDWLSDAKGLSLEMSDPLGRTLLGAQFQEPAVLSAYGSLARKLAFFKLRETDGALLFKDHFLGLYWQELPCLFTSRFPQRWQKDLVRTEEDSLKTVATYKDQNRWIEIWFEKNTPRSCVRILRESFWFFKEENIRWCFEEGRSQITLPYGYEVIMK